MTIYKFTTDEESGKVTVKDGGTTHLEVFPAAEGHEGLEQGPHEDMGSVGWNKKRGRWTWENNDTKFAMMCAAWCVKKTRASLPFGTFNNTMVIDGKRTYLVPKKEIRGVEKMLAPKLLVKKAEKFFDQFARSPLPVQLAARGHGCLLVKGGVCSLISHVCLGFITQSIPADGEAAVVYHSADHSFCVLRYKTSPWIVVDPWPMRAYVFPWDQSAFRWNGLLNNVRIKIHKKVTVPYGVAIARKADDPKLSGATGAEDELAVDWDTVSAAMETAAIKKPEDYGAYEYNRKVTDVAKDFEDAAKHSKWYFEEHKDPDAECPCGRMFRGEKALLKNCPDFLTGHTFSKRGNFHTDHVWLHKDVIHWPRAKKGCKIKKKSPYREPKCTQVGHCDHGDPDLIKGHMDDMKPVAGADSWGDPKDWGKTKTLREYLDAGE